MKKILSIVAFLLSPFFALAQTNPAITQWLQNTTKTGSYYTQGNSTTISNNILVNCQQVRYSANWVYVNTYGIPAYPTGPFLDGNPSQASNQNAIYKIPLNPTQNTGTPTNTTPGNIGVFINGVSLFDYRDGVAWNTNTSSLCGGPGNPPCSGTTYWNRDAVVAERVGFDCSKGHPAMGNYHHHQNPSAFKLDLSVISNICNLYDADALYVINPEEHSPLIGFAYDGFPIYGAYGYKNADGSGGIVRIKSGYQLRNITQRTHYADGSNVPDGPSVSTTYPLGYFREDYEFIAHPEEDYLDAHNGRFCVTPEYPNGIYCYFATVDEQHNSAYPYVVGPTFYGNKTGAKVSSITESVSTYALPQQNCLAQLNLPQDNMNTATINEGSQTYSAQNFTASNVISDGSTYVKYGAENTISLTGGFSAEAGAFFEAIIEPCSSAMTFPSAILATKKEEIIRNSLLFDNYKVNIFPNPASEFIIVQMEDLVKNDITTELFDISGKLVDTRSLNKGQIFTYIPVETLYEGVYFLRLSNGSGTTSISKVFIQRP
ncbi:MAG: YHYH protein [Chitinophagales bacterium]|nr:YHYH protein [Bacteroidota bacterium]